MSKAGVILKPVMVSEAIQELSSRLSFAATKPLCDYAYGLQGGDHVLDMVKIFTEIPAGNYQTFCCASNSYLQSLRGGRTPWRACVGRHPYPIPWGYQALSNATNVTCGRGHKPWQENNFLFFFFSLFLSLSLSLSLFLSLPVCPSLCVSVSFFYTTLLLG